MKNDNYFNSLDWKTNMINMVYDYEWIAESVLLAILYEM